jgi:Ser/Thr protein kinase RdoA (MazF antagonist)
VPDVVETPEAALQHYAEGREAAFDAVAGSLVNRTWAVDRPPRFALQLVSAQFGDEVNHRIDRVAERLTASRIRTPHIVRTAGGALSLLGPEGRRWRLLTWVPGRIRHVIASPEDAGSAGALVARFHDALYRAGAALKLPASGFHDTEARLAAMQDALGRAAGHPDEFELRHLGAEVLRRCDGWLGHRERQGLEPRPGHGDLKLSNVVFEPHANRARALIDLDTLGLYTLDAELGDALRSWCNTAGEDRAHPRFDLGIFSAAVTGYCEASKTTTRAERDRIVFGFGRITLELAARFLTDAVDDSYFGWDPAVAPSRARHNLLRAAGQLELFRQIVGLRSDLESIVRRN